MGSVLVECEKILTRDLRHWGTCPPEWSAHAEIPYHKDTLCLPELLALIRRWLDEGKLSAIRDLTELKLWD